MPWVAAAATVAGAAISSQASKSAANKAAGAQMSAAEQASATQQGMYDQTRRDLSPYRMAGGNALNQMQQMTGGAPSGPMGLQQYSLNFGRKDDATTTADYNQYLASKGGAVGMPFGDGSGGAAPYNFVDTDPGAQFRLRQGEQGTNRAAAARGLGNSGNVLQELAKLNSDYASQEFGNSFNRLQGMATLGQNAATQTGTLGAGAASGIAGNQMGAGNAQAAGIMGANNATNAGIGTATNAFGNWWQQQPKTQQQPSYGQAGYNTSFDNPSDYG